MSHSSLMPTTIEFLNEVHQHLDTTAHAINQDPMVVSDELMEKSVELANLFTLWESDSQPTVQVAESLSDALIQRTESMIRCCLALQNIFLETKALQNGETVDPDAYENLHQNAHVMMETLKRTTRETASLMEGRGRSIEEAISAKNTSSFVLGVLVALADTFQGLEVLVSEPEMSSFVLGVHQTRFPVRVTVDPE